MIKIQHVVLPSPEQMEFVIEGMRNPMNSWDKSDSHSCDEIECCEECRELDLDGKCGMYYTTSNNRYSVGPNDLSLMRKLSAAGTDHRKFMRMMPVMIRITAPLYWWKEFDTYKVGTVANSCSTMHRIAEKSFGVDDFSMDELFAGNYENENYSVYKPHYKHFTLIIDSLNNLRDLYLKTNDKRFWRLMIEMLPSSYNQTRNVMCNYECLKNMYHSRKNHKLDEWVELAKWIETLPYSELITGGTE